MSNPMDWSDFSFGIVLALPFLGIKRYALRTALSAVAPAIARWFLLKLLADPRYFPIDMQLVVGVLGGFCGAHIRFLWVMIQSLMARHLQKMSVPRSSETKGLE